MVNPTLRLPILGPLLVATLLELSCASTPAKPSGPSNPARATKLTVTEASPVSAAGVSTASPAKPSENDRELGPGQCNDGFDCVDTVGFPAPGQRWICEAGKCAKGKLPSLVPEASSPEGDATALSDKSAETAVKAKKRRR
jgi:hypothetical protein